MPIIIGNSITAGGMDRPVAVETLHDPILSRLGYLLWRASWAMMADLGAALAEIGLRPVEDTIQILIDANPGCIQSDLGRMLGIRAVFDLTKSDCRSKSLVCRDFLTVR
jgi:hypothetical protein